MKRKVILGTDWWTDCDDVVAARLLSKFVKAGQIDLLGVVINAEMEHSLSSLDAFFISEGLPGLPIGITPLTPNSGTPPYQKLLSESNLSKRTNRDAEDGVKLYRRLLSQSDGMVDMLEIGFHNAVEGLLRSTSDEYSPLSGIELVRSKVSHLWVMAGKWDVDGGLEYNIRNNESSARSSAFMIENFPSPITFLGFEVGESVITGSCLKDGDLLCEAMKAHSRTHGLEFKGRSSWDPMTTLLCCIGDEEAAGYNKVCGRATVDIPSGANHFVKESGASHCYVVKKYPDEYYVKLIDAIIAE